MFYQLDVYARPCVCEFVNPLHQCLGLHYQHTAGYSDVDFSISTELHFRDVSTDTGAYVLFDWPTSVTVNEVTGYLSQTAGTGATVTFKKVAANEWDIFGLLAQA